MDLKTVFSSLSQKMGSAKPNVETFLTVKISSSEVAAATWSVASEKVELGPVAKAEIASEENFTHLLEAADQAISQATEKLAEAGTNIEKIIFGLPFHWVAEGKVVPEKLNTLRKLCQQLELKPMGYVLLSEALENYYKETEGAPLTAILLEFDGLKGLLTMYRAGKNLGTAPLKSEIETIGSEVEKALKEFTQTEIFPSRIIVYDGKDSLKEIAEKITAFPWTKNLPFLHFPKVEIFDSDQVVRAVAVAGGMQMGGHFEVPEAEPAKKLESEEKVAETPAELVQEEEEREAEFEEVEAAEAGFLPESEFGEMEIPTPSKFGQIEEIDSARYETPRKEAPSKNLAAILPQVTKSLISLGSVFATAAKKFTFLTKLSGRVASQLAGQGSKSRRRLPIVIVLVGLLFGVFAFAAYSSPRVNVIIKVSSPPFDKELSVAVATDKSSNQASGSAVLLGSFLNVSEIGTKRGVASGQKLVGDKAKGSVTIGNPSDARTFPTGTVLTSTSGLKFVLTSNVQVATGAGIYALGTGSGPVAAADIGDQYNLPVNALFSIANFSGQAKSDNAFSGGNSHQANVVTKEDQNRLTATLSAELTDKARADLEAKLSPGQKLLPNAITSSVSKKKFSKDVGAEGDTVSLDLTMDFSGVIFSQDDLVALFSQKFAADIPSGFYLVAEQANLQIKDIKADKSGNAILMVHLTSGLVPKIDIDSTRRNLAGKSLAGATQSLLRIPGVVGADVVVSPKIFQPLIKIALPWKRENIKIEIVTQN